MLALALLLIQQQPATPSAPPAPVSPITRVTIQPATDVTVQAGDTVRLAVTAYDADGKVLPKVKVRWFQPGGHFEGTVSEEGVAVAGSPGTIVAAARVSPEAGGAGRTEFARITVTAGPAATVEVAPTPARLYVGQSLLLRSAVLSASGDERRDAVTWRSDAPTVVQVSSSGRITARGAGRATVTATATAGRAVRTLAIAVVANPVASVALEPARTTVRAGDVVKFAFTARTAAGGALADAAPEWSIAPGNALVEPNGEFVADVPGTYRVVATFAGRSAEALVEVGARDAVRATTIVGRLPIKVNAGEFWLHPTAKAGYLTTLSDRVYAIDLSDPGNPRIADSVVVNARVINDLMTTEDGKFGVLTREGASDRKNGIVILSFEDPLHPKPIGEFTETVTGGVHSTFIYKGYVYLTDDATGSMRVIDIRDPLKPKQVARWETPRNANGRILHDIDVQDGLAYLSYWNDGLVILDVGNGIKGGRPESPQLVSTIKYDLNALYRDVEAVGGPGFIRGTHTAWRHGKYVFVGDEVFSAKPVGTAGPMGLGRAYGRLHVVDVSDLTKPKLVAYYEPKDGGTHNVWVAGDTLYLGDYQGGLRILDISGELRGDLLRQGREIAHVFTGDQKGVIPQAPMAWGAIYRDGLIYVPDVNSGLWVVKVEQKSSLTP